MGSNNSTLRAKKFPIQITGVIGSDLINSALVLKCNQKAEDKKWKPDREDQQEGISNCRREDQSPSLFPNKLSSIAIFNYQIIWRIQNWKETKQNKKKKEELPWKLRGECKASLFIDVLPLPNIPQSFGSTSSNNQHRYTFQIYLCNRESF